MNRRSFLKNLSSAIAVITASAVFKEEVVEPQRPPLKDYTMTLDLSPPLETYTETITWPEDSWTMGTSVQVLWNGEEISDKYP